MNQTITKEGIGKMVGRTRVVGRRSLALLGAAFLIAAFVGPDGLSSAGAEENLDRAHTGEEQARTGNRIVLPDVTLPVLERKAKTEAAKKARDKAADKAGVKDGKKAKRQSRSKTKDAKRPTPNTEAIANARRDARARQRDAAERRAEDRRGKDSKRRAETKRHAETKRRAEAKRRAETKRRAEAKRRDDAARRAEQRVRGKIAREQAERRAKRAALENQRNEWDAEVTNRPEVRPLPRPRRDRVYRTPDPLPNGRPIRQRSSTGQMNERALERALSAPPRGQVKQRYSIDRVMGDFQLRSRLPRVDINTINFRYDDAQVPPGQIHKLRKLGRVLRRITARRPWEVFLLEGHTDLPGRYEYNLDLSEERARAVKWVLVDNFDIPPESLVTRGYGEQFPVVRTEEADRINRRVAVRRLTPMLRRGEKQRRYRREPRWGAEQQRRFRPYRRVGRPYYRSHDPY